VKEASAEQNDSRMRDIVNCPVKAGYCAQGHPIALVSVGLAYSTVLSSLITGKLSDSICTGKSQIALTQKDGT